LAGHSTAVFIGVLGRQNFSSVTIFDYPQGGAPYAAVGSAHIRSRFEALAKEGTAAVPRFDFYAGESRDTIPVALATGHLKQCDFISLDGSKMVPDVIADFTNLAQVAHPGTIVVCDDVWTSQVLKGISDVERQGAKAMSLNEHNVVMAALVSIGALEVVDVWHSDVDNWPSYGNIALRYKLVGRDFTRAVNGLLSTHLPKLEPLPMSNAADDDCSLVEQLGLPPACCRDGYSAVPVTSFVSSKANDALKSYWRPTALKVRASRVATAAPAAAGCAAYRAAAQPPVNVINHGPHLINWAAGHNPLAGNLVCTVNVPVDEAARVLIVAQSGNARWHSVDALMPDGAFQDGQASKMRNCRLTVIDAHSWGTGDGGGTKNSDALSIDSAEPRFELLRAVVSRDGANVVVTNIFATGVLANAMLELQRRPRSKAAYKGDGKERGGHWRPNWQRIADYRAADGRRLSRFEVEVAFAINEGWLHVVAAELPPKDIDAGHGTLVLSRQKHAQPWLRGRIIA
jgi:hypothetical protein